MTQDARLQAVMDKFEIIEVSTVLLCCRDSGDWQRLAQCLHPDAHMTTSWFSGTASEFIKQASQMMEGHHPGDTHQHMMSNPRVTLTGNRAVCEYYLLLHQRRTMDGYEFDFQTWSQCVNLLEKREGVWRISKRSNIYEKDRMDPYVPGSVPQSYFDQMDLSRYPKSMRYHCYRNEKSSGRAPTLILKGTDGEKAVRNEAQAWLAGQVTR
jgi:hypothetical protein